jgi:hypothetical protein
MPRQMTLQLGPLIAPRSPLMAYREDLALRGDRGAFGLSDSTWLGIATVLGHLVGVPPESRAPLIASLREVVAGDASARQRLDAAEREASGDHELDVVSPIVRAVVEDMEDGGALGLAYSTLWILADADLRLSVLERGRVLAQLGRVAWKAGALETSHEHYRRVEVLGRVARSSELRVRAWVGYSILARIRGNYPEVRKWGARATHEADRAGLTALGSLAYHNLMAAAAVAGDINTALAYGWRAFQGATGNPAREADMLLNLSQLLHLSGHPEVAIHGFAAALARQPAARVALPTLGGMALAASAIGDAARVRRAWAQAERLIATTGPSYEAASTLLELSEALAVVADIDGADACRTRALAIATQRGFHELTHRGERQRTRPDPVQTDAPHALDVHGRVVARAVRSLGLVGSGADAG